jgi:hypothetical protein
MFKIESTLDLYWPKQHMNYNRRKPNISYFHQFECTCYILNNKVYLKKFDVKAKRGIFLGYSERSKAYRVHNSEMQCVEESMHNKFDDKKPEYEIPELVESFADIQVSEDPLELDQIPSKLLHPRILKSTSLHIQRI